CARSYYGASGDYW
nr:immunoglobulin heavy chain junction region [Macaca mulatta]MOW87870.1 immunoglobulin heavy chain junction region [Macaca mulatta]MOW88143.1 immunoglobulin heavy chain junction region [Macaca mulatta]MOW88880.1 immunoglobulin heavy chain junction region [Macaca mulatta]MOW89475.1 immunoglobulin heavy chain junction region [Macaca mulatta]